MTSNDFAWQTLPLTAQLYVAAVIAAGVYMLGAYFPVSLPDPALFGLALVVACMSSVWKVTLPVSVAGESTLSVAYAADLMALVLLGPAHALVVAVVGAWAQCTLNVRGRYPFYRTVFSMGAKAVTMTAVGFAYTKLGGPTAPIQLAMLTKPLVGAIGAYFVINTGLVAGAIALSTQQHVWKVWRDDFLWSASGFMVGGSAGALAAIVIHRGEHWQALLMLAPVYLTFRTYQIFTGRLEDQERHERALAEEKEREMAARASAEEANRLKDQFLAMVSHELRTPLTAILGWAEMLRTGKLENGRRDRACQVIYDSARRQAQMIEELLDVARIVSGKLGVTRSAVDLADVVRDAVSVVQPASEAKRIVMTMDADPLVGAINGDGARLQQIVWNLLSNAVKFTPEGGTVEVTLGRVGDAAELVVIDNGRGIAPEFLPYVFDPFRQADGSTTRQHGGLGLGLAIVKHLVDAHGGTVTAANRPDGCGAIFTVRLPMILVPAARPHAIAEGLSCDARGTLEGVSVLVVDDDDDSRQILAAHLESHRAVVHTAASSPQALDLLQRQHVDVLLADIAMPGEDGYSLVRKVRASSETKIATLPAVALTALAREEDRQQALQAGFHLHLTKPIDAGSLVAAVASVGAQAS